MVIKRSGTISRLLVGAVLFIILGLDQLPAAADLEDTNTNPRINIPYSADGAPYPSHAIFWFGKVDLYHNYSDVRIIYYETGIKFTIHTIDRRLWIDTTPTPDEINDWDSISLYLNTDHLNAVTPQSTSYRIDVQLGDFYSAYKGNGSGWIETDTPLTINTSWRGDQGPNSNTDSKGWVADIFIPFSSFGSPEAPSLYTIWGLAVAVHDSDDAAGDIRMTKTWPETTLPDNPATWGEMSFGWKPVSRPKALPTGSTIIQHGFNNIIVRDGEVVATPFVVIL
jgi:hypothetical protein